MCGCGCEHVGCVCVCAHVCMCVWKVSYALHIKRLINKGSVPALKGYRHLAYEGKMETRIILEDALCYLLRPFHLTAY